MKYIYCWVGSSITPATFVSLFYTQHRVLTIAKLEEGSEFGKLYYIYLQRKIKEEKVVHHRVARITVPEGGNPHTSYERERSLPTKLGF